MIILLSLISWYRRPDSIQKLSSDVIIINNKIVKKNTKNLQYGADEIHNLMLFKKLNNIVQIRSINIEFDYRGQTIDNVPDAYMKLKPIIETLYEIIKMGYIYIDIKYENILIDDNDKLTLIDFEICYKLKTAYVEFIIDFHSCVYRVFPIELVLEEITVDNYNSYVDKYNHINPINVQHITSIDCFNIPKEDLMIQANIWSIGVLLFDLNAEGKYLELAKKCINADPMKRPTYEELINEFA